jgi:hypothetical protein
MDRKPDDQNPTLGSPEKLAQYDPGVARRTDDVGTTRHQLDRGVLQPSLLRRQRVEQ